MKPSISYGRPSATPGSAEDLLAPIQNMTEEERFRTEEYAKKATFLTKHMVASDKYSGSKDNFDIKFKVFLAKCTDVGLLTTDAIASVFHHLLTGEALEHYFDRLHRRGLSAAELIEKTRARFQTEERAFALEREWNRMSLKRLMADSPEKSVEDTFNGMVTRLRRLQGELPLQQGDERLRAALLNATLGVPAVAAARLKPSRDVEGLISDFQGAIAEWSAQHDKSSMAMYGDYKGDVMYVDRRFNSNSSCFGGHRMTPKSARPSYPRRPQGYQPPRLRGEGSSKGNFRPRQSHSDTCYVCGKQGCRSWKHPPEERAKAAVQFLVNAMEDEEEDGDAKDQEDEEEDDPAKDLMDNDEDQGNTAYFNQLTDTSAFHTLTAGAVSPPVRYGAPIFAGILIDTGANYLSTAGKDQYDAYCQTTGVTPKLGPSTVRCRYGVGHSKALGAVEIQFPFAGEILRAVFHVMDADIPFLLCLSDMKKLGVYCNSMENRLVHSASGRTAPLTEDNGHLWIRWNPVVNCLLTEAEIYRLHRRFGHTSAEKLHALLLRADRDEPGLRRVLEAIEKECQQCQRQAQAPRRFKFAFHDSREFNHTIYVDIVYINSRPILHVVDEGTKYQAALS